MFGIDQRQVATMFHTLRRLRRAPIIATDGKMGELNGFFFDEKTWQIRFLVADTLHLLAGREVLISPDHFKQPKAGEERLHVDVTRDQIRNSPDLSKAEPIDPKTRRFRVIQYSMLRATERSPLTGPEPGIVGTFFNLQHLHGTDEVTGYTIHATDGEIGHLVDFIFDDESWIVRYLVVDTGSWWPGRKVLLSPDWIESMNWYDKKVFVSVTCESTKTVPDYDPLTLPDRAYEEKVFDHYQRPKYWIPSEALRKPVSEAIGEIERP